uniref:Neurotransmitter-gated ion-channel ligand-binding domain-containing protein n=1 Tax=Plectus sambesii TaxID=2011161 RepID=A0A914XJ08_9BILA
MGFTSYYSLEIESINPMGYDVVRIINNGEVRLGLKYNVDLTCIMEIGDFPFDTQDCPIIISLWSYNYSEAVLHLRYPIVGLAPYNGDPEYAPVMGNISEFEIVTYSGTELMTTIGHNPYSELHYSIGLKRRPAYYVFVMLIPSYLLTSLCIIGIFTPNSNMNERNEKVTLGLTTLLSMTLILNIVADQMPKGREGLALLGKYFLELICFGGLKWTIR